MEKKIKDAVENYQCPGCVGGSDISCFVGNLEGVGCSKHVAGTFIVPIVGNIFLGMPVGFNRKGEDDLQIQIYSKLSDYGEYNIYNIPCWKHKDKHGNTLVRGLSPRLNLPFLHIFLDDCLDKIDCLEITEDDIKEMD